MNNYKFQILSGETSQAAVKRVNGERLASPIKKFVSVLILAASILSVVSIGLSSSALTSQVAEADVLTDMFCVSTDGQGGGSGSWGDVNERFGQLGGRTGSMESLKQNVSADAVRNPTWAVVDVNADYRITAFEKYGSSYPKFETWTPSVKEGEFTFAGVSKEAGLGTGDAIPAGTEQGSEPTKANTGSMVTRDLFSCINILGNVESWIANSITFLPRYILEATAVMYTEVNGTALSDDDSYFGKLLDAVDDVVAGDGGLTDNVFLPFMLPLITLGACWVAYNGIIKRNALISLQNTGWMILAIAVGTVFLAQPSLVARSMDSGVTEFQNIIYDALPSNVGDGELCSASGDNASRREATCALWKNSVYDIWADGQFGQYVDDTSDPRGILNNTSYTIKLGSESIVATDWAMFQADRQATGRALEISEVAYAELSGNAVGEGVSGNPTWASGQGNQIMAAITMAVTVVVHGAVPLAGAFALILFQIMLVIALMLMPFYFLVGILPSWGRKILLRYAEFIGIAFVLRIVVTAAVAIYFKLYSVITSMNSNVIVETFIIFVIAAFMLANSKKVFSFFRSVVNFGGNKSIGLPMTKAAASGAGLGGAVAGGLLAGPVGALIGGLGTKKAAKESLKEFEGKGEANLADTKSGGSPTANAKTPTRTASQTVNQGINIAKTVGSVAGGTGGTIATAVPAPASVSSPAPTSTPAAPASNPAPAKTPQKPAKDSPAAAPATPASTPQKFPTKQPQPEFHQMPTAPRVEPQRREEPTPEPQQAAPKKGKAAEIAGAAVGLGLTATGVGAVGSGAASAATTAAVKGVQKKMSSED